MVNLRARQYEPATMRFSQRDIIRGFTVIPSTQNRYAYCLNSPLVFTDPSGEFVLAALLIGAAIGAIVGGVSSYKAQKAATGKVDGWKVAKDALIGGVVGAVAGLVGAAVASVLVPAVGATTLTTAGISTRLTFLQSAAVASVSAVSAGVAARATNAAVRNTFTNEPKRNVAKDAFNPKAMTTDAVLGMGFGALTHGITGGIYNTTSIDSRYKGSTTPANPKPTQGGKTNGSKAADNPSDDIVRDSSGEYAGEQYGGAAPGKNAGTTACTEAGQVAGEGIKFSNKLSPEQWLKQVSSRGWNEEMLANTINNPYTTRTALNRYGSSAGSPATAYYNQNGSYVVVDDISGKIIQVSDFFNPNWIPDASIINPFKP